MNSEELAAMKAVCEQRDRAREALGRLVDKFWSAHYNHTFDAEDTRYVKKNGEIEKDENGRKKEYRCSAGRSLMDCFYGCDLFDKEVCKGHDCPMGFNHRLMYECVREANEVLDERSAEFKPFDLERIPEYDMRKRYNVTAAWYARMCLMFFNSFSIHKDYGDEQTRRMRDAAVSLVSIGLSKFGVHFPIGDVLADMNGVKEIDETAKGVQQFRSELKTVGDRYADREKAVARKGGDEAMAVILSDMDYALYHIVIESLAFIEEFTFGHDYPSADLGVYSDALSALKYKCVKVAKLPEDKFDLIQNMNDATLDADGFTVSDAEA